MNNNLFVVSRLGQVRNVQSFIRQTGATNNHLAIIYTEANRGLLASIEQTVEPRVFGDVVYIKQPDRPLSQSNKKNRVIYRQLEELLVGMSERHGVASLHLCNIDAYYSFFERIAAQHALKLEFVLLEEGLTTYANAGAKRYSIESRPDWSDVRHRSRAFRLAIGRASRSGLALAATLLSWAVRIDVRRLTTGVRTLLIADARYRYGSLTHFDRAFVYFPEKIHDANLKIDAVERLEFSLQPAAETAQLAEVAEDAVVFVSQKYIPYADYFDIAFRILGEMGVTEVLFKFHPRESVASYGPAWQDACRSHPRLHVSAPAAIQSLAVEELMMAGKVKQLIGLTSTSLMYASAFFPAVEVVSIGQRFRELADSAEYEIPKGALAEFNRDLEVFSDVSDVRQF